MKMIYAIVRAEDGSIVIEELNRQGFSVTRLSTTGGFLRKGNSTLLIGTEDEKVDEAIDIIRKECGKRQQIVYNMPYTAEGVPMNTSQAIAVNVDAGGATIFVLDVDRYEKV